METAQVSAQQEYLTVREFEHRLGLKPGTGYVVIKNGGCPYFKIGRLIRIAAADLATWLESRKVTAA